MGFFDNPFGGKNPADVANKYLNQIPGAVSPYYQPYINQGQGADAISAEQYKQLIGNPGDLYSRLGAGYKESPGYQFKLNQALQSGTNAAAAGGMAGSPAHQQGNMQVANDIASQDYDNYMNHILGLYGTGLQGNEHMGDRGFQASMGYGDILGSNLGAQAQYGYSGQAGQNANRSNMFNNFIQLASMGLGGGMGRGRSVGPMSGSSVPPWMNPG